jgi:glycosyltransferase involved in cell wall biosynthesis
MLEHKSLRQDQPAARLRVLIVHNFYQIAGGEDSVVSDELAMLRANGVEAELFSVTNHDIKGGLGAIATAAGVIYNPAARGALGRRLGTFRPDIVHIHNFFPRLSPSILDACRDAGVPAVMTLHNFRILCPSLLLHPDERLRERSLHGSCWWTVPAKVYRHSALATLPLAAMVEFHKHAGTWARKVDRFIALSEWARLKFIEGGLPEGRIVVRPTGVARPPPFDGLSRDGALFVGRLDPQKGVDFLVRAWKNIDFTLKIIGDGPLADFVRQNAGGRITYLGRQPREIVQREMQSARFMVLPSIGHEMFPVTVLEAFANGLPVLCSALPSLAGLVQPEVTGLTFAAGDADALKMQVARAAANRRATEEMGARALATYEEKYTPEASFDRLIGIYRSVTPSRQAQSGTGRQ